MTVSIPKPPQPITYELSGVIHPTTSRDSFVQQLQVALLQGKVEARVVKEILKHLPENTHPMWEDSPTDLENWRSVGLRDDVENVQKHTVLIEPGIHEPAREVFIDNNWHPVSLLTAQVFIHGKWQPLFIRGGVE